VSHLTPGGERVSEGFLLPVALLMLVALTGMTFAAFLLAGAEIRLAAAERSYVELLARTPPPGSPPPAPGEVPIALGRGFVLFRLPPPGSGAGPAPHRVAWMVDPDRESAEFVAPVEIGMPPAPPADRILLVEGPCGWEESGPRVRFLDGPEPPILGPLPFASLLARVPEGEETAPPSWSGLHVEGPGLRVIAGEESWLVVVPEWLEVTGPGVLRGLILADGDVSLAAGARLEGAVRTPGRVVLAEGAVVAGDRCAVRRALSVPILASPFPISGGERLGRY
jgi:hypothetical protein